jgi:hypothetical protein
MKNIINFLCFGLILFLGCEDSTSVKDLDKVVIPSANVSYSQYIQPVFNLKCNNSGCHDDADRAGGLSLSTWANATASASIVFPKYPGNSKMIWAIKNQSGATQMPPLGQAALTANQISGITTWISEGAKNN